MSSLISCNITNPDGKSDECAQFVISDAREKFTLAGVAVPGNELTFSFWARSEATGTIIVCGEEVVTATGWSYHSFTFEATAADIVLDFETAGTYYIYHAQLEKGNRPTDWTPAPEDLFTDEDFDGIQNTINDSVNRINKSESAITQLTNMISTLVRDENGQSLMVQTGSGWTFNMGPTNQTMSSISSNINALQQITGSTQATVSILQSAVEDLQSTSEYIRIGVYDDEPCIELGESDSDFKLLITNTRIAFWCGSAVKTYINSSGLVTDNITVNNEFKQGSWIWKARSNGHYSLIKG